MAFPATIGLAVLSFPIVTFIIGRGKVTFEDVKIVSDLLSVFAVALPAYVLNKILIAACFSDSDTKTPLYATIVNMIVNKCDNFLKSVANNEDFFAALL